MAIVDEGATQETEVQVSANTTPAPPIFDNSVNDQRFQNLEGMFGQLQQTMNVIATGFAATQQRGQVSEPELTDAQIDEAISEGRGAGSVRQAARLEAARVAQRVDRVENIGLGAIANLTKQVATSNMQYYKQYQKEIDAHIDSLPLESRLNAEVYQLAHDAVVGKHTAEIVEAERQKTIRAHSDGGGQIPGVNTRDTQKISAVTVASTLGEESEQALLDNGHDGDSFARKLGYTSYENYIEVTKKYEVASRPQPIRRR